MSDPAPTLEAALAYARRGWPVLPLHTVRDGRCFCGRSACTSPGKHPRTEHGAKDATTDETIIRQWWTRWPDANIGIATGGGSGLVVVDVDPRNGGDDSLDALERQHGALPQTVEALTGGGGRHILFAHPGKRIKNGPIAPGVDLKADGGYIVAPPSLHASGRAYTWDTCAHPDDVALAPLPPWLIGLPDAQPSQRAQGRGRRDWRSLTARGATQGQRNTSVAALAGHLLRRGVDPVVTLDLLLAWNQSRNVHPLADEEVTRTVNSVAGCELRRRSRGSRHD